VDRTWTVGGATVGMDASSRARLKRWMVAVCAFDFHLVDGQTMLQCVPEGAIGEEEARVVSYHAFPDNLSLELHNHATVRDSVFFFRVAREVDADGGVKRHGKVAADGKEASDRQQDMRPNETEGRSRRTQPTTAYLYGYVFCRQRQDPSLPRGGDQKSVVVLAEVPRGSVLKHLACIAGQLYFDYGPEALEQMVREIATVWESPQCGRQLSLPVSGFTITSTLPPASSLPPPFPEDVDGELELLLQSPGGSGGTAAAFNEANVHESFKGIMDHLWTIWELALLGEPLIVVAPSSYLCSEAVASLLSLISPLPYFGEIRPYFTIHDPYFHTVRDQVSKGCVPGGVFGITNLVVLKSLQPWPHVVSIGDNMSYQSSVDLQYFESQNNMFGDSVAIQKPGGGSAASRNGLLHSWVARKRDATSLISTYQEKLWSSYQPCCKRSNTLLNRVKNAKTASVANLMIRQHFGELTRRFLEPFADFFKPSESASTSGGSSCPSVRRFSEHEFFEQLGKTRHGATLESRMKSRASLRELYKRFMRSTSFLPWLTRRQAEIELLENMRHGRCHTALDSICKMSEVELVDLHIKLKRQLATEDVELPEVERERIQLALDIVHKALPGDLQESLRVATTQILSPRRAAPQRSS